MGVRRTTKTLVGAPSSRYDPAQQIRSSLTLYVSTTGSDVVGDGSIVNKFASVARAFDWIKVNTSSGTVTINVDDGSYAASTCSGNPGAAVSIVGNTTTPANVSFTAIAAALGANISIAGMTVSAITADSGGKVSLGSGIVFPSNPGGRHMSATQGGQIQVTQNYTITGGTGRHMDTFSGEIYFANGLTVTLTGTPAWSLNFCGAFSGGVIRCHGFATAVVWSGASTGSRFIMGIGSMLDTNGTNTGGNTAAASLTYFPGNSTGSFPAGTDTTASGTGTRTGVYYN